MSLGSLFCKLFRFWLNILGQVVEFILGVVESLGKVGVKLFSSLAKVAKGVFGSPLLLIGGCLAAYLYFTKDKTSEEEGAGAAFKEDFRETRLRRSSSSLGSERGVKFTRVLA